ncbi:hypothetical protein CCR75_001944 [Bremia lactucae]|uniref:Jacalin-type lectin domain-containing protein n=1 Tax=Bremia lactucae TaxID=4779 RepID=A0A976IGQ3_BRELC|nr:hypothetical protein CCR75_001944 [Bremia lactucae]
MRISFDKNIKDVFQLSDDGNGGIKISKKPQMSYEDTGSNKEEEINDDQENNDDEDNNNDGDTLDGDKRKCRPFGLNEGIQQSSTYGGPHGNEFSDKKMVMPGQNVTSVTLWAGERLDGLQVVTAPPRGVSLTLKHGGQGGKDSTYLLEKDEHINSFAVSLIEKNGNTRIGYLKLGTTLGKSIEGGTPGKDSSKLHIEHAPANHHLGGFHGRSNKEIDMLGALWVRDEPEDCSYGSE